MPTVSSQATSIPSGLPTIPQKPTSVQPGGGWCVAIELAWGRLRRPWLRLVRPGYVRKMKALRKGECPGCTHNIIDARDLKYYRNVCGFWFRPEDDRFGWRDCLGLARHGLAEVVLFSLLLGGFMGMVGLIAAWTHPVVLLCEIPFVLVWLEIIWFFRDPERAIPPDADALVSPADGVVTNVEEVAERDFPNGRALRISIFLSIFNVHVNRLPCAGRVREVRYFPGAFLDARNPQSAVRNEQLWIDLQTAQDVPIRVKQISGAIARRIVCWLKAGDNVGKGERLGMIKLGSRTDLLVPAGWAKEVCVPVGTKVRGGVTILLRSPSEPEA